MYGELALGVSIMIAQYVLPRRPIFRASETAPRFIPLRISGGHDAAVRTERPRDTNENSKIWAPAQSDDAATRSVASTLGILLGISSIAQERLDFAGQSPNAWLSYEGSRPRGTAGCRRTVASRSYTTPGHSGSGHDSGPAAGSSGGGA